MDEKARFPLENGREACNCRYRKCPRHGRCAECIAHHAAKKKPSPPSCKKRPKEGD